MTITDLLNKTEDLLKLARSVRDGAKSIVPVSPSAARVAALLSVTAEEYARSVEPEVGAAIDALEQAVTATEKATAAARLRVGLDKLTPAERTIARLAGVSPADLVAAKKARAR